ncbi:hypothetical protein BH09PLA1_BH09PLA1_33940 [soil metagenome]
MRSWIVLINLSATLFLAGCAGDRDSSASVPPASTGKVMSMAQGALGAPADAPRDAAPAQSIIFQVEVYRITVPFGTFAGNEAFWKRVDEQCVDPFTNDLLNRNGIRVGQAPLAELDFFRKFMEEKPVISKMTTTATEAPLVELEMRSDLPEQRISLFAPDLRMRDYDASSNVLNLSFQPAPRKPGCMRLTLCPMVRSHRKHFQYTVLNNETELKYISPEMFYDLNLRVDIPKDRFFVVMPSADARYETSVGRAFLTKDGPLDRYEQILLIVPHAITGAVIGESK